LETDRPKLKADGLDLAHVVVKVVDAHGVLVPEAAQKIHFAVTGAGTNAGVDNGNQYSNELWQAGERSIYHGQALLVVRAARQAGVASVRATAAGLESAELELSVE
jgi:beta-galactosidase